MAKTAEQRAVLQVEENPTKADTLKVDSEAKERLSFEEKFPIVRASELSLEDAFLKHEPTTIRQTKLKLRLIAGIKRGLLEDFRCPAMDPSLDEDGNLVYEVGKPPAVGKKIKFWVKKFKQFMPEKNSRIGTGYERAAFLGFLIKYLTEEEGYEVSEAWEAICDNTQKLKGHEKHDFEPTGSRKVGAFYDLTNTTKVVAVGTHRGYMECGSSYVDNSGKYPMSNFMKIIDSNHELVDDNFELMDDEVAWMVSNV